MQPLPYQSASSRRPDVDPTLVRDEMNYWLLRPEARLKNGVKCYFVVEVQARQNCKQELHLPDGYAELVFILRAPYQRAPLAAPERLMHMKRSYLIGGRSHSIVTSDMGNVRVVGVKLEPRLLRKIIATPLCEFRDSTVELAELDDTSLLALEDELAQCSRVGDITGTLNRFFLAREATPCGSDRTVDYLLKRIRAERGATLITQAAHDCSIDPRTLERRFTSWMGISPKAYARIVRFKHAYHAFRKFSALERCRRDRSYLEGYYDQSHFIKEFHFFTGSSPASLLSQQTPASTDVTNHLLSGDLAAA